MPRDLFPQRSAEEAQVSKNPEQQTPESSNEARENEGYNEFTIYSESYDKDQLSAGMKKAEKRNDLHPYVTTLSLADVESCIRLEDASFPEHERCSREKVRSTKASRARGVLPSIIVRSDYFTAICLRSCYRASEYPPRDIVLRSWAPFLFVIHCSWIWSLPHRHPNSNMEKSTLDHCPLCWIMCAVFI